MGSTYKHISSERNKSIKESMIERKVRKTQTRSFTCPVGKFAQHSTELKIQIGVNEAAARRCGVRE